MCTREVAPRTFRVWDQSHVSVRDPVSKSKTDGRPEKQYPRLTSSLHMREHMYTRVHTHTYTHTSTYRFTCTHTKYQKCLLHNLMVDTRIDRQINDK